MVRVWTFRGKRGLTRSTSTLVLAVVIQLKLAATELLTVITALDCFADSLTAESTLNRRGLSRRDLMSEFESKIGLIASISPFKQPTGMIA
jgi:hypothetical protein